jgi:hypothetical protein
MEEDHSHTGPRPRDNTARDDQLRRQIDGATPSLGLLGLIAGVLVALALLVYFFSPPAGDTGNVASRDTPAPSTPSNR